MNRYRAVEHITCIVYARGAMYILRMGKGASRFWILKPRCGLAYKPLPVYRTDSISLCLPRLACLTPPLPGLPIS